MLKLLRKIAGGFLALFILWAAGLAVFIFTVLIMGPHKPEKTTDAIVVLTGGAGRVETGLALFAAGSAKNLFITGVYPDVRVEEITALWTGAPALPACCITLGHKATTTVQNGEETREWLEKNHYTSIRLVTSNYHMLRSYLELKHMLPGVEIIPHPIVQPDMNAEDRYFWQIVFIEYHKTLYRLASLAFPSSKDGQE